MNHSFRTVSEISVCNEDLWSGSVFLTIDIDWACDEVLADTIDLVERADVCSTWFVTHETPLLERLRRNPKFELGIHPNFNKLLQGDGSNGRSVEEVFERVLEIVPEARAARSHSLMQSTPLHKLFAERKITHECNCFIPAHADMDLRPWSLWKTLTIVPLFWEDDLSMMYDIKTPLHNLVRKNGLKVFNFHPIHVFLNTESLERYERARKYYHIASDLQRFRNAAGTGMRTELENLLGLTE